MYSGSVFRNNRFESNLYSIDDSGYGGASDIDTSNTVNGKPVYYWVNQHNKTVPFDAGFVALQYCSGINVQSLNLEGNAQGILLIYTNDSTIKGNILTRNLEGITLKESCKNVISDNLIKENKGNGVYLSHSTNNVIVNNEIKINSNVGVNISYSTSNIVTENQITENGGNGIFLTDIKDSNIAKNNVTLNNGCGIGFGYGPNGIVKGNIISKNDIGIWISNAHDDTIILNNVTENSGVAVYLEGDQKNNQIYNNNFINNKILDGLQANIKRVWSYPGLYYQGNQREAPPPKLVAGAANYWDNGKEGNYWSDYKTRYPNASGAGLVGAGNTPYVINENNSDHHPLIIPIENINVDLPPLNLPSPTPSVTPNQDPTTTMLTPRPEPQTEFHIVPLIIFAVSALLLAVTGLVLLIYFNRQKR